MILRKPYAMLIKLFKPIHFFLAFCMSYLIYRSYLIRTFLFEYMKTSMMPLGFGATNDLTGGMLYIAPIIVLIILVVMLITMIKKEKPKLFYIIATITYFLCFILFNYLTTILKTLEEQIVAVKDIRLAYDLTTMILIMQVGLVIITAIRAIGFDIKKFDFKRDLMEMDIVDDDSEEFEVSFNVEGNIVQRFFNKQFRTYKYLYLENLQTDEFILELEKCDEKEDTYFANLDYQIKLPSQYSESAIERVFTEGRHFCSFIEGNAGKHYGHDSKRLAGCHRRGI